MKIAAVRPAKLAHVLCIAFTALAGAVAIANAQQTSSTSPKGKTMHAAGEFTVKLDPQSDTAAAPDAKLGRMTIDKQFHGDLEASSQGQMLSAMTETKGSAGYVAIEKVTGKLAGRSGSFVLQHNATMTRGVPYLNIIVVPDSGTGELTGITGTMQIKIDGGKHSYEFDYALPN